MWTLHIFFKELYIGLSKPQAYPLLWHCPQLNQKPGCLCCRQCFLRGHCHCSDLRGQASPSHGHVNDYRAFKRHTMSTVNGPKVHLFFQTNLEYAPCLNVHWVGRLTARPGTGVKVREQGIQLVWTEQGVPTKLCCSGWQRMKLKKNKISAESSDYYYDFSTDAVPAGCAGTKLYFSQ